MVLAAGNSDGSRRLGGGPDGIPDSLAPLLENDSGSRIARQVEKLAGYDHHNTIIANHLQDLEKKAKLLTQIRPRELEQYE